MRDWCWIPESAPQRIHHPHGGPAMTTTQLTDQIAPAITAEKLEVPTFWLPC